VPDLPFVPCVLILCPPLCYAGCTPPAFPLLRAGSPDSGAHNAES